MNEISSLNGWGAFKPRLTDAIINHLEPIQKKYSEVIKDEIYLNDVLKDGRDAANELAEQTLKHVKDSMGFHSYC